MRSESLDLFITYCNRPLTSETRSRKYYFVQISTGESTWDTPTQAAPQVPTPGTTPAPSMDPYGKPGSDGYGQNNGYDQGPGGAQEGERGLGVSGVMW